MLDSVRTRLTLWYVGVLALVLVSFSVTVYVLLARNIYARLDDDLSTTLQETGFSLGRKLTDEGTEAKAADDVLDEHIGPRQAAIICDEQGHVIADNPALDGLHAQLPPPASIPAGVPRLYTTPTDAQAGANSRRVGTLRITTPATGKTYLIVVSQPLDALARALRTIRLTLGAAILVALMLAGVGGWFLARRSLAPVVEMTERAHRISAENLEQRLPVANSRDELGRLAATFNELLARLNDSFAQQRRFMADASHELRTPLSVMRTATGVTLGQERRSGSEYREALRIIDEQARRLTRIVEDMFTLARADSGRRALQQSDFQLNALVGEAARAAEVLATRKGVRVELGGLLPTPYRGDEGLLRQMFLNLLDNAVKHTPTGGHVRVQLERATAHYTIIVADTGAGIAPADQPHIFERFYRADKARARADATEIGAGAGLGLSIARWIAEAHEGRLELARSDERGTVFVAILPAI